MQGCGIANAGLDQIVAPPTTATAPLQDLDFSNNRIEDTVEGESLARFLLRCGHALGANGARMHATQQPFGQD